MMGKNLQLYPFPALFRLYLAHMPLFLRISSDTAKKYFKKMKISCCKMDIMGCFGMENPGHELLINLNQGGLIIPSLNPVNYV